MSNTFFYTKIEKKKEYRNQKEYRVTIFSANLLKIRSLQQFYRKTEDSKFELPQSFFPLSDSKPQNIRRRFWAKMFLSLSLSLSDRFLRRHSVIYKALQNSIFSFFRVCIFSINFFLIFSDTSGVARGFSFLFLFSFFFMKTKQQFWFFYISLTNFKVVKQIRI